MSIQPLTLDELEKLWLALRDPMTLLCFRQCIWEHVNNTAYRQWMQKGRYQGVPYRPESNDAFARMFSELGLLDEKRQLRVQLHEYQEHRHFLTDTPAVPDDVQVFPWLDESMKIAWFVRRKWPGWGQYWVDPMCGAGYHNIILEGQPADRISMDVNPRAVAFARINSLLNNVPLSTRVREARRGLLQVLEESNIAYNRQVLVMVNPPLSLSPYPDFLTHYADAAETGAGLSMDYLNTVRDACARYRNLRLCQLVYTVGNPETNRWQLHDYAQKVFRADRVSFELVTGCQLWRVNRIKVENNPMPLSRLRRKAECVQEVEGTREERRQLAQDYDALAARLKEKFGATHLACGILTVDVT